jgi:1,2-diacylglycerol 3-beta-galactosyltransferase
MVSALFLVADTGGGHRRAAEAVATMLLSPLEAVLVEPLGARPITRRLTRLYGPIIRHAPSVWGWIYRLTNSQAGVRLLQHTVLLGATGAIREAVDRYEPAVVVSFHPLATAAAVRAGLSVPTMTVVTDLATAHSTWRARGVDLVAVPSPSVLWQFRLDGWPANQCVETGLPVATRRPVGAAQRRALRRSLGLPDHDALVVVVGGGEGAGGMAERVTAIVERLPDVHVVAICGRNGRLARSLARMDSGRLTVKGFVGNMADWLRAADVVVGKAGPGTIAEAACCGAPLLLTGYVPGQEEGNAEFVVGAGSGRYTPTVEGLIAEIERLRAHPAELAQMRAAAIRSSRGDAARLVVDLVVNLAGAPALLLSDQPGL